MTPLTSRLSTADAEFCRNREAYRRLIDELHGKRRDAAAGGPPAAREKHLARGKILPRERVELLLDPGSPWLELAQLAGAGLYAGVPPGASLITGIGLVSGRPCMIIANDATVKGGTYYGMTCRKHVRAQQVARAHRLPCITLVDSGGAYIPALSDQVVIVREQGYLYLGGPELTFAATGEQVDAESLGGAQMHCALSGVTDHVAQDDRHALAITRELVRDLGEPPRPRWTRRAPLPPRFDPQEIYGIVSRDPRIATDTREILARFVDDSRFQEFKPLYGDTLLTGFAHLHGHPVGILANQGVLFSESALKAAHFIELCCQRDVPLLFMSDVTGFMVGRAAEQGGIAKAGAKMITAMASANVPKYSIVIGASYGAGYLAMCGRPFNPTAMFAWPNARAAIMGPEQAATVLALVRRQALQAAGRDWSPEEEEAFKAPIRKTYVDFQGAYNFASHLWIDGVLDPLETRDVMGLLLELAARTPAQPTPFGVFRF